MFIDHLRMSAAHRVALPVRHTSRRAAFFHRALTLFLPLTFLLTSPARADSTYFPLSSGNFSQDWSNTGLITANDDWSAVPSMVGYLGQDITTATGTNPQMLLGTSAAANDVDAIANATNPSISNGGVAEFHLANPTIAFQGSGTADAPHLILHLDTTGRNTVVVSYTLRDIDATADNAVQPVAVQYRVGATGNFIDLPAGFVSDATTGPSLATATAAVSVTLPAAAENQPQVQVRIMTTNAVGNDEWVGVDDIVVTSAGVGVTAPSIMSDPVALTVTEGQPAQFTVAVSGTAPLSYQWRKGTTDLADGGNISGALTDTLLISPTVLGDAGSYNVVVTNSAGSATSSSAALVVDAPTPPSIATHPLTQNVSVGSVVTFTVVASGSAPIGYQWKKGGVDVTAPNATGASTATLTLSNVQLGDAGSYTVVATNGAGTATSNPATLTVNAVELYWDLNAGDFTQDWTNTSLIAANDNWANVPSVIGYLGQDLTGGTGTNPQTILDPSSALNDIDVIANQANPNTLTSGGVAEFHLANPTIALQGSGTGDAPHLVLHLNMSGRTAVNVSYHVRDVDGSADNSTQQVALHYRVGDTGEFIDVPAGYVADATTPSAATLVTPVSVTLPAAVDNQPKVQVRIMTTNAVGNDEWVGIDDIVVASAHDGVARVFVMHTNDSTLVAEGGAVDSYRLRLNTVPSSPVTIRAMADAQTEVSADGVNFGSYADVTLSDTLPKAVTVRAADDATNEAATHFSTISHAIVASSDSSYSTAFPIASLVAGVVDDDGGTGLTRIHVIQGSGATSPLVNYQVTINGVVTGFLTGSTGAREGFFVQEEAANADSDVNTSEGVYVFAGATSPLASTIDALGVGDVVTVTGYVAEFNGLTEVSTLIGVSTTGTAGLPPPVSVTLPLPGPTYLERYEGMLVTLPQTLTVTDTFDLGRFGQTVLSNGRLPQPTNIAAPGAPAQAQAAANALNQIVLDDTTSRSNPDPTPYLFTDGSGTTLRAGDSTTNAMGVITYQFGLYMLEPSAAPVFTRTNPRSAVAPAVGGSLRVSVGNVLNLFNGDGAGGGFPTARGATNFAEYQRQLDKVVAGTLTLAPDIMGLTEVENDGYGPASALAQFVDALNAAAPAGTTYAYVDAAAVDIVTDLIHSAFIYRTETVETVGQPAMLSSPYFNNHARNPLAQTFREKATGGVLTVSINHFRAKASASSMTDGIVPNPNLDQGDGQGTNNYLRTKESEALVQWLATDPTGSGDPDFLIIGDLNAYAKEDPIVALEQGGYTDLTELFEGESGYSYSFDGAYGHLDHALATASLTAQTTGAATWHVNADEPIVLDYNTEDKSAAQQALNVGTPFRYSDHDPVVIGLNLTAEPDVVTQPLAQTTTVGQSVTFSVVASGAPAPTFQWRKDGTAISGATGASYTITNPVVADAGSYDVVVTNSVGSVTSAPVTLVVNPAAAAIGLSGLTQAYDGQPKSVTTTTTPSGLAVSVTYNGSTTVPTAPGAYAVVATITDPNYVGTVSDTLLITIGSLVRHAPTINGGVDGSIQVLLPESFALNGNAWVSGDILVPGTPSVRLNSSPTFAGPVEGAGAANPTGYQVTLNGGAVLRHLVRRTDPIAMPSVGAPAAPSGTRNVAINSAGQSIGDPATLRNLTLNGSVGPVALPPGAYGSITANGNSAVVLGVVGGTSPAIYDLQSLTLNGSAKLVVVGPVRVTLANGVALNGSAGAVDHPEWLTVRVAAGGVTLNGGADLHGSVVAPTGAVTINGGSGLKGSVTADRLTINGGGVVTEVAP